MAQKNERNDAARGRARRTPRFVLPHDHHDERTAARIEAFLAGPSGGSRRRATAIDERDRLRRPRELDTRPDWTSALLNESSRHARYGRPASVLLIELDRRLEHELLDRQAREIANQIRVDARDTDRAVRIGATSFRLLLPETSARAARQVMARLERSFQAGPAGQAASSRGVQVRIEIAAPIRGASLEDALTDAERRLAG